MTLMIMLLLLMMLTIIIILIYKVIIFCFGICPTSSAEQIQLVNNIFLKSSYWIFRNQVLYFLPIILGAFFLFSFHCQTSNHSPISNGTWISKLLDSRKKTHELILELNADFYFQFVNSTLLRFGKKWMIVFALKIIQNNFASFGSRQKCFD